MVSITCGKEDADPSKLPIIEVFSGKELDKRNNVALAFEWDARG